MGGFYYTTPDGLSTSILYLFFEFHVKRGSHSPVHVVNDFKVFAPAEFVRGYAQKPYDVSLVLKMLGGAFFNVIQKPDHADCRSRINRDARGFIVKNHVSAYDRNAEFKAGLANSLDRVLELPHDLRPFRASEVKEIGKGKGHGARYA